MTTTYTKTPDLGAAWSAIGHKPAGTLDSVAYAGSFVAPVSGPVSYLGCWFMIARVGATRYQVIRFDVCPALAGNPASGPDSTVILASSNQITLGSYASLAFRASTTVTSYTDLVAGTTYFFVAQTKSLAGDSSYYVGGHTQNSVYVDNGIFWYANDVNGATFTSRSTPAVEMGFTLTIDNVIAGRTNVNINMRSRR